MTINDVLDILQGAGGYGVAALLYWQWQKEREERMRYRDQFEKVLENQVNLTHALDGLTNEVAKLVQKGE